MNLAFGGPYDAFRATVREFLHEAWGSNTEDHRDVDLFRARATRAGLLHAGIPVEYGGGGGDRDPIRAQIVEEEFEAAGAPGPVTGIGVKMLAPTLLAWGTEAQKHRFLPATLAGKAIWCQGYSEPEAGSDLASLRTAAVLDNEGWTIQGRKIWTSDAHRADFMFLLARTEPEAPRHRGLSYLLLDMRSPGIVVRPLIQITGESHFNEVLLDAVRTPSDWIVGRRGQGWEVGRTTLAFERSGLNGPRMMDALFDQLIDLARRTERDGQPLINDPRIRDELAIIEAYGLAQRYSLLRQTALQAAGEDSGLAGLVNKLSATDLGLRMGRLFQDLLGEDAILAPGPDATRDAMDPMFWVLRCLAVTIAGGSSNIQRNIIAERGLGLPRSST